MKNFLFLTLFLFSSISQAASAIEVPRCSAKPCLSRKALEQQSRKNQLRVGSFGHVLKTYREQSAVMNDLGLECAEFVLKVYDSGNTLWSQRLHNRAKWEKDVPVESGVRDHVYYHYTKDKEGSDFLKLLESNTLDRNLAQKKIRSNQGYEQIFLYYRAQRNSSRELPLWGSVHYLAEDPESSSNYGSTQVRFKIDPRARVLEWNESWWDSAIQEINARHPGFSAACMKKSSENPSAGPEQGSLRYQFIAIQYFPINFLIAEDSLIDLIDYFYHQWFQLVSPRSIVLTEIH